MTNLGKSLLVVPLIVLAMPFVWIAGFVSGVWNLIKKGLNRITEFCGKDQP